MMVVGVILVALVMIVIVVAVLDDLVLAQVHHMGLLHGLSDQYLSLALKCQTEDLDPEQR